MLPISDYDYALPPELIAQTPPPARGDSRLLHLDNAGQTHDLAFSGLPSLLRPGDLLVFNDTRVIKARLAGHKATGGKIEVLIERITGPDRALAHVRASKSPAAGMRLRLAGAFDVSVLGREGELFDLQFPGDVLGLLDTHGATPLPPYITHAAGVQDEERYQTVYARSPGAVAAPTAGLHFDAAMLERLAAMGVERAFVTLHVGAGTFQPVRVADITEHVMHAEWYTVPEATIAAIEQARARGSRVIAVGTTSLRALESAARPVDQIEPARGPTPSATAPMARSTPSSASASSSAPLPAQAPPFPARRAPLERKQGDTRLFIAPGYRFGVIDALITNFHLPQSTLLMLVSALAGVQPIRSAYAHAVARRYRFFSYGDAMFIESQASL